jgi:drug/metabolite transporter (DMT)-like permease
VLSLVFAALSALVWGAGDFCGGKASQRANSLMVTLLAEAFGVPILVLYLLSSSPALPSLADLAWGTAAGLVGVAGLVVFYRGLAGGAMSIVAPVTATTSAALPLGLGLLIDRTPGPLALAGAALAVVSIGLVSLGHDTSDPELPRKATPRILGMALLAGVMFGLFFTLLSQADPASGAWPLLPGRVAGVVALALAIRLTQGSNARRWRPERATLRLTAVAGSLDMVANALYLFAVHRGMLSIAAPIASLYPVSTVVLAMIIDRERMRPIQLAGLGLAATALVLTAS